MQRIVNSNPHNQFYSQPVASCAPRTSADGLAFIPPLYLLHIFLTHYQQEVLTMNELFLSGMILTLVKTPTTGDTSHVVCQLRHSHRNRQQQVIHETYTVHAWNRLADWAVQTLKPGARVYVKGYLTQKLRGDVTMTEVTAAQFFVQNPVGMEVENQLAS